MTPSEEKLKHVMWLTANKRPMAFVADTSQPGCRGVQVSAEYYDGKGERYVDESGVFSKDKSWFLPWFAVWGIVDCDGPNDASAMRTWPKPPRPSRLPDGWRVIKGGAS